MDEPVVTAGPPPTRSKNLAQQEADFTSEGSPPPGSVGPGESLPAVDIASDHIHRKSALPITVKEATACDAAQAAHGREHEATSRGAMRGKAATRLR